MEKASDRGFRSVAKRQERADHTAVKPRAHLSLQVGNEEEHGEEEVEGTASSELVPEETPFRGTVDAFEDHTVAPEPADQFFT
jgi:hypothetical protein